MSGRSEFDGMLRELAQQRSALSQQQTALLQLQAESLRLQRLLIERAMGDAPTEEVATASARWLTRRARTFVSQTTQFVRSCLRASVRCVSSYDSCPVICASRGARVTPTS